MALIHGYQLCHVRGRSTFVCAVTMDFLQAQGVSFIQFLQSTLGRYDAYMLFMSHMGDPRNAFLIYFPIVYCLSPSVGRKVVWVAALSEWMNAVLKWLLYGNRPYWWVQESSLYNDNTRPDINQYPLTCETGPGSPSGHAMVTASVWFIMVHAYNVHHAGNNHQQNKSEKGHSQTAWLTWLLFTVVMTMVALSRLFIATHFPHQVVLGTIVGMLLGMTCSRASTDDLQLIAYIIGSVLILVTAIGLFFILQALNLNPGWSIPLAMKWCAKPEYIHLDTTPFFALSRDAGCVLGLGVITVMLTAKCPDRLKQSIDFLGSVIAILGCVLYCLVIESIPLPQSNILLFYIYGFVKNSFIPIGVVCLRTAVASLVCRPKNHNH
ncbi:glucose-6-phosphatase 2-like [Glandiceps talaboti]